MIRINQLKIPIFEYSEDKLRKRCAKVLKVAPENIRKLRVIRRSTDARKKNDILFSFTVDVKLSDSVTGPNSDTEKEYIKKLKNRDIVYEDTFPLVIDYTSEKPFEDTPVVVGAGPCGLFCALILSRAGLSPILIERGESVDERVLTVNEFFDTGSLNKDSNVQFGEGGAGTFSDGKLNTSIKGQGSYIRFVLQTFHEFGADEEILYDAKPHIGTDRLIEIVRNIREEIIKNGGKVLFNTKLTGFEFSEDGSRLAAVRAQGEKGELRIETKHCVLAIGHSARDTFELLYREYGLNMERKPFAMGLRIQHTQKMINEALYGRERLEDKVKILGPASYKLTHKCVDERSVYSFCMCPGGYVVNSSSEEGRLCVNGMSYSDRSSENANSAIVVNIRPEDFKTEGPLAGVEFQRELEEAFYIAGNGNIPMERYGDFKEALPCPSAPGRIKPVIKGYANIADIRSILPVFMADAIEEGIEAFSKTIEGFNDGDALLCGVESRTSSPVRILRDDNFESSVRGIYPAGEGAGYAGGITSAAVDGIKTAQKLLLNKYNRQAE